MIKNRTHLGLLKEWQPADEVLQRLAGSGFDHVCRINTGYRTSIDFLLALVDCYSIDQSCFIFGEQRITPTLEDVAKITGFPIDGLPVIGRDFKVDECSNLCNELLLSHRFLHKKNKCDIVIKDLLDFKDIPLGIIGAGLDPYIRAYVLYVISCFLTPPRDHRSVPCMFLGLLRDIDAIKNYAWGAALLCHLHNSFREFKTERLRGKSPTIMSFCAPFLTFFFYEHMPVIPRAIYDFDIYREDFEDRELIFTFPLMVGWSNSVERKSRNAYVKKKKEEFDLMLTNDNIMWQPYARLRDDFLPDYLAGQMDIALSRTILICFEKLAHHRPDLCPLKMNLQADLVPVEPSVTIVNKKRTASQKFDWNVRHAVFVKMWEERRLHLIVNRNGENQGASTSNEDQTPMM